MLEEATIHFRQSMELWVVRDQLVARQQAYSLAYMKEDYDEVRHYYCPNCGKVWGLRANPDAESPRHFFYKSYCREHNGDESMLNPWEWAHIEVLGPNVLAYLILTLTEEVENESRTVRNTE